MRNKASQAYRLREFGGDDNSEPNATLNNIKCHASLDQQYHVQLNRFSHTCFQRRRPRSRVPVPRRRRRSKPASMMRSKIVSAENKTMRDVLHFSMLVTTQAFCEGTHTVRICGWMKQEGQRTKKKSFTPMIADTQ